MATRTGKKPRTQQPQSRPAAPVKPVLEEIEAEPEQADSEQENALKTLRRALGGKVIEQSDKIAQSLVDSTLKGNSSSARIMVDLVSKRKKDKTKPEKQKAAGLPPGPDRCSARDLADDVQLPDDGGDISLGDPDALRGKGRNPDEAPK